MAGKQDGAGEVAKTYILIYRQQAERNRDRHWAFYDLLKPQGPTPVMHFLQQDHTSYPCNPPQTTSSLQWLNRAYGGAFSFKPLNMAKFLVMLNSKGAVKNVENQTASKENQKLEIDSLVQLQRLLAYWILKDASSIL